MNDLFESKCPSCGRPYDSHNEDAEFAEWWAKYPNKVGKGQARTAFKAARKKAPFEILLSKMIDYGNSRPTYVCHPATWLNGERWLDNTGTDEVKFVDSCDLARRHVQAFLRSGMWLTTWGPAPNKPDADPQVRKVYEEMRTRVLA